MRQTHTTWRRLVNGGWKQSISLTRPLPEHVVKFLEQHQKRQSPAPQAADKTSA